jgi:hypothetical protein
MRVVAAVVCVSQLDACGTVLAQRERGLGMVVCRVVVRQAVAYLGNEEGQTQEKAEDEARDTRAAQMPHRHEDNTSSAGERNGRVAFIMPSCGPAAGLHPVLAPNAFPVVHVRVLEPLPIPR